jgi:hypothetical protein
VRRVSSIDFPSPFSPSSQLYPSSKSSSKSSSKIFFSNDNNKEPRNQIIIINSFNKLSSLSMRTNQGDQWTNTTWHRGANILWGKYRSGYCSKEVSFEGSFVVRESKTGTEYRIIELSNIGVSIESKLLTPYRSSVIFSRMIVI